MDGRLPFSCDYLQGAHPRILKRLSESNFESEAGYGEDSFSEMARERIRLACASPDAEIYFLLGGTQSNATVIDALLRMYQGVIAADSGHINVHETGAIEADGHKVLTLKNHEGKISASQIEALLLAYQNDENQKHMVMPGMVYLSHPTEYGSLYSKAELREISELCRSYHIPLYLDGARLAYALACPENDLSLSDIAKLCDVFYIGGTKCGALLGEAVVIPKRGLIPHMTSIIKQHGALLEKGRILGIQFDELFRDRLYERIGVPAIREAGRIRSALLAMNIPLCFDSPSNQIFCLLENRFLRTLSEKVDFSLWERYDETHSIIRLATSWASRPEDSEALIACFAEKSGRKAG